MSGGGRLLAGSGYCHKQHEKGQSPSKEVGVQLQGTSGSSATYHRMVFGPPEDGCEVSHHNSSVIGKNVYADVFFMGKVEVALKIYHLVSGFSFWFPRVCIFLVSTHN